jgi:acyl-CoA synthetase (AMP-forming)/AMP-acid ligase II
MAALLLQVDLGRFDLGSLRYLTNTAAALPAEHVRRLRALLPHVAIYSMYGLTECKRVSYLPPAELDRRPTSIGRAIPNTEVYLVDEHDRRLGPGAVGELVVRGSHVTRGYWELPGETQARFRPGPVPGERVLYTGDLVRMDDEGYLYFVGRKDDIIKTRGEKVSPREVEEALHAHPAVAEAAVVGVPDPVLGEAIHAVVTLRAGAAATEQEIVRHCRQRLEDFMVPRRVEVRTSLPTTATGKVARRALAGAAGDAA